MSRYYDTPTPDAEDRRHRAEVRDETEVWRTDKTHEVAADPMFSGAWAGEVEWSPLIGLLEAAIERARA